MIEEILGKFENESNDSESDFATAEYQRRMYISLLDAINKIMGQNWPMSTDRGIVTNMDYMNRVDTLTRLISKKGFSSKRSCLS